MKKISIDVNNFIKSNKKACIATACTAVTTLATIAAFKIIKKDK